eukprot:scaffold181944_cov33-Prasinocladus_malaysianus.AAC.2
MQQYVNLAILWPPVEYQEQIDHQTARPFMILTAVGGGQSGCLYRRHAALSCGFHFKHQHSIRSSIEIETQGIVPQPRQPYPLMGSANKSTPLITIAGCRFISPLWIGYGNRQRAREMDRRCASARSEYVS